MPDAPPVTSAVLPVRSLILSSHAVQCTGHRIPGDCAPLCPFLTAAQTAATETGMTVRPPRQFSGARMPDTPQSALDYEIAQEKATTLGRLGRRLEATLAELAAFDAALTDDGTSEPDAEAARRALVDQAGNAL